MTQANNYPGNEIDGWMTLTELQWLAEKASNMQSIAEIGCFKGRSTHSLLWNCKGIVFAIDQWLAIPDVLKYDTNEKAEERFHEFKHNLKDFSNLTIIRSSSEVASKIIQPIDMVFIDGDHSPEAVIGDILNWGSKALKLLCGHDYGHRDWPGVKLVVDAYFDGKAKIIDSIWYMEYL